MMTTDKYESVARSESQLPIDYELSDQFETNPSNRLYERQFNAIYRNRVNTLKSRVFKVANSKWKDETVNNIKCSYTSKVLDIVPLKPCFIIGTVFCDYKFKGNVLRDVSEHLYGAPEVREEEEMKSKGMFHIDRIRQDSYSDPKTDQIMLEDESGRVVLDGELLDKIILVTGVIVGLLGMEVKSGIFTVVDIVYPEPAPQRLPFSINKSGNHNKIMFLSGLNISSCDFDTTDIEILKDYLMGEFADTQELIGQISNISHLYIVGNSIRVSDATQKENRSIKDKYKEVNKSNYDTTAIGILDQWIHELLSSIPITIIPGESDPADISLPQQEFHRSLFTKSSTYPASNFQRSTNPSWFEIDGLRMLGTSGENINDVFKYLIPNAASELKNGDGESLGVDSRIKIVESNMIWQNIIPTSPDTLWCYPFEEKDPFTLTETPNVYFVGNQPNFESKLVHLYNKKEELIQVRVISIPVFSETGKVVLLDSSDLSVECIQVST